MYFVIFQSSDFLFDIFVTKYAKITIKLMKILDQTQCTRSSAKLVVRFKCANHQLKLKWVEKSAPQ